MKKVFVLLCLMGTVSACGKLGLFSSNDDDAVKLANATVVMESMNKEVEELGINLRHVRLWKSTGNSSHPGVSTQIATFNLEVWFELYNDNQLAWDNLTDDEKEGKDEESTIDDDKKYRYSLETGLVATDSGALYEEGSEPGTTIYMGTPPTSPLNSEGLFSYTISEEDSLVATRFPVMAVHNETTGSGSDQITLKELVKAHEVSDSDWAGFYTYSGPVLIGERIYYEKNEDLATTAKMGCLIKKSDNGEIQEKEFLFDDVELGTLIQNTEDALASSSVDDDTTLGDDDVLWIKWIEQWYITGFNHATRKLRMIRIRKAPIYSARELPGVDSGDDKPSLSGFDGLIWACNKEAGSGGSFMMLNTTYSTNLTPVLTIGGSNAYCSSLASANIDSLDTTSTSWGACGFSVSGAQVGTWNGSGHSGPVSVTESIYHVEMSEVVEVDL